MTTVVLLCVAALLATGCVAIGIAGKTYGGTAVYLASAASAALAALAALVHLIAGGDASTATLPLGLPWLGAHFRMDALTSFFLVVVNLGAVLASVYAIGYGRHDPAPHRVLPFFPAFLGAMNLVVLADDAFSFLVSWEFMSLVSWALVMAHHRVEGNARAGYVYLAMASFGTLALLLAFGMLAGPEGGYGFAAIRAGEHSPLTTALVFGLLVLGAGSKAGLVPLHVWLPLAHPAAPSHVSALMSGVMTKVAVYGFIRVVFDLLGPLPWWPSLVLLALGATTAVLGILHALMERDLKRLLAYSTIENIGVIFVSLGLALAFRGNAMNSAAALALTAALFHVLNHSLFKSLLFFGSGAVLTATGHRDMDQLGGLIHRMPRSSVLVLVGCLAISALPPLNGFVSEWLAFQAILQSPDLPQWALKILVPGVGGLLALAAALTAACFVKLFGISFLGRPRSPAAAEAREVDRFSLAAMGILAGLCLIAGIFPGVIIDGLAPLTQALVGDRMPVQASVPWLSIIPVDEGRSSYNGLLVFLFIALSASLAIWLIHRYASRTIRRAPPWDCGFPNPSPTVQYGGGGFAQPLRRVFGPVAFAARDTVDMPMPGERRPARLTVVLRDRVWDTLYAPIARAVAFAADRLNHLQFLTIRRYLSLVFLAVVLLLLVLAIWQ